MSNSAETGDVQAQYWDNYYCHVYKVKEGKTEALREYCRALEKDRREQYEASQRWLRIATEVFFLWEREDGDYIVLFMNGPAMTEAFHKWVDSDGDFERFGNGNWNDFVGMEGKPSPLWALPGTHPQVLEVLSVYNVADV